MYPDRAWIEAVRARNRAKLGLGAVEPAPAPSTGLGLGGWLAVGLFLFDVGDVLSKVRALFGVGVKRKRRRR